MKELFCLAVKGIKRRRKSSILIFGILSISISFAVIAFSAHESMNKSNEEYRYDTYGTWEGAFLGGYKEDFEVFNQEKDIFEIGTAVCYGTVAGDVGYGTVEKKLKKMGRIRLLEGDFPQAENEIVMEADVLSKLKHNYKIGQKIILEISFPAVSYDGIETTRVVSREYKLCGVLKEYTDLWCVDEEILPGILVTEKEALRVSKIAEVENTDVIVKEPKFHYFFKSYKDKEQMLKNVGEYISSRNKERGEEGKLAVNTYAYEAETQEGFDSFYIIIIFITTLLAVLCIYMVQMQKQIQQIKLFRSIGITKRQLRQLLLFEILCLAVPAMLMGILMGSAGTWLSIKGLIKVSTQKVYVTIPIIVLLGIFLLWVLGMFGVCAMILWIALRQSLVGRKIQRYRRQKYIFCNFISIVACLVFFLGVLCSCEFLNEKSEIEKIPAYRFMTGMPQEPKIEAGMLEKVQQIPGINHIAAWGIEIADMKFAEIEKSPLVKDLKDNDGIIKDRSKESSEGIGVVLYGIREENWEDFIDFEKLEINRENFRNGSEVIVLFPVNAYGEIVVGNKKYKDTGIIKGEQLTFDFYGRKADSEIGKLGKQEEKIGEHTAKVSAVVKVKGEKDMLQFMATTPYNVVCSAKALETMLDQLPDNYILSNYDTGKPFGYAQGEIFASSKAGYFSTDYVVADLCSRYGIFMDSYREENSSRIQGVVQKLIQLCFGSGAIFLIALMMIWNILSLAGEEEKNKIGILRAVGMSKKQQKIGMLKESVKVGIFSVIGGWICFGVYLFMTAWNMQRHIWTNFHEKKGVWKLLGMRIENFLISGIQIKMIVLLTLLGFCLIVAVYYGTRRKLLKRDILELIQEEE